MTQQRILVIFDGKPGHLSQALGMARLIAERQPDTEIHTLGAKPLVKLLNRPLRWLAKQETHSAPYIISSLHKMEKIPANAPSLIISFGGNVVALSISLSRYWNIPNILIGNSYGTPEHLIDCHATAFGEQGNDKNRLATGIALCKADPVICTKAAEQLLAQNPNQALWSLFVGGNGSGYEYRDHDWYRLGVGLKKLSAQYHVRWLISSSRRTGTQGIQILKKYAEDAICADSIWYGEKNHTPLDAYLGAAERIFCTADSLSMLSEAVAMTKPVIALHPQAHKPSTTHDNILKHMFDTGLIEQHAIDDMPNYRAPLFQPCQSYQHQLQKIYQRLLETGVLQGKHLSTASPIVA